MNIFSLSYHSRNCLEDLVMETESEIGAILRVARSRNEAADVTGALLFTENRFCQILEGGEREVKDIFDSIKRDRRHTDVTIIGIGTSFSRRFASWSMAFAGTSIPAQEYYRDYVLGRFAFTSLTTDALCQLMMKMIEIDGTPDRLVLV